MTSGDLGEAPARLAGIAEKSPKPAAMGVVHMIDREPLLAIVYDEGADVGSAARGLVDRWRRQGLRVCGLIERKEPRPDRRRCDMFVLELASGIEIRISDDRGSLARGCMLNEDALGFAESLIMGALAAAERLIVNKFGKVEALGGGLRAAIAEAIMKNVPSVVFVPKRNLTAWREFSGELAREIEMCEIVEFCGTPSDP